MTLLSNVCVKQFICLYLTVAYMTAETHFQNHSLINEPSIVLDDVRCYGNESRLTQCFHRGIGLHNCDKYELAGAVCIGIY